MSSTRSRSPPALNAPSAPRTTTARVSSSSPIVVHTRASSPCIAASTALRRPAFRSVIRKTCVAGRSSSRLGYASYGSLIGGTLRRVRERDDLVERGIVAGGRVDVDRRDGERDAIEAV